MLNSLSTESLLVAGTAFREASFSWRCGQCEKLNEDWLIHTRTQARLVRMSTARRPAVVASSASGRSRRHSLLYAARGRLVGRWLSDREEAGPIAQYYAAPALA